MTPNTWTHNGRVLFQCLPSTASQSLSSPPSFKSISHFVSAWFSPSLFQKCSLNHFIFLLFFSFSISHLSISALPLPLRSFSHLKPYQISPPTIPYYSYYLYYSIPFILFTLFPPQRLIKSALCYDSHIFIQACPSKAQTGTILLQTAICSLKGTCHFRTREQYQAVLFYW